MKKFIVRLLLIAAGLFSTAMPTFALAGTLAETNAAEFQLNQANPNAMAKNRLGTAVVKHRIFDFKCTYDFSVQGGAIGTVSLLDPLGKACSLPNKAIVLFAFTDVVTAPTSGGSATLALSTGQVAADIMAATAVASVTGLLAAIPVDTAATMIKLTADRAPTLAIAVAALTAGKLNVHIRFVMSE